MLWYLFLACLAILVCVGLFVKRFRRWFLASGCAGVLAAIVLYTLGAFSYTRPFAIHAASILCPEMTLGLGLGTPPSPGAISLLLAWVFGTNFVLYGVAGILLGGAWMWIRRGPNRSRKHEEQDERA